MRGIEQTPWLYDALMRVAELGPFRTWRRAAVRDARGRVLDVGCGTGRNFPHYPSNARIVGIDPELSVLKKARKRAPHVPVVAARAEALPFRDGTFDHVVSTLVFCSVDDPTHGLEEIRRVLTAGGELRMLEHVRAKNRLAARAQDGIQPLWTRVTGGCRPNRKTVERVEAGGFVIAPETFRSRGFLRSFVARPGESASPSRDPSTSRSEIREYYRTVGRFIELELAARRDGAYWRARAEELGEPAVLEIGAGTGRVTRTLAPHAELVVGIDLSPDMLSVARERLDGLGTVHLVVADMRELALARTFDLALAANDPFSHLPTDEERDRALSVVARHLRPGGLFLLDALWFPPSARERLARPGGWSRTRELGPPEHGYEVKEWWSLDPETWRGRVRYQYRQNGRVVGTAAFEPRFWRPEEVERRFASAGLTVRRLLGGFDGRPWDPDRSRNLIVEAILGDSGGADPIAGAHPVERAKGGGDGDGAEGQTL